MKKVLSLILALVLCLSLAACGGAFKKQAYEVAEELHGTWGYTLGEDVTFVTSFEHNGNNGGKVELSCIAGDKITMSQRGTYTVSTDTDNKIICDLTHTMDDYGEMQKNKEVVEILLQYTYSNDNLILTNGNKKYTYVKISDEYMTVK